MIRVSVKWLGAYWQPVFGIGIAALCVVLGALAQPSASPRKQHTAYAQRGRSVASSARLVTIPPRDDATVVVEHPNTKAQQNNEYKLAIRDVQAAETSAKASIVAAIFSAIGAVGLGLSLLYSAKATRAALDAARSARETLHANRAYITNDGFDATWAIDYTISTPNGPIPVKKGVLFRARWKNTGASPALEVTSWYGMAVRIPSEQPVVFTWSNETYNNRMLGQGQPFYAGEMVLTDDETAGLKVHGLEAFYYTKVSYRDIFNPTVIHTHENCWKLEYGGEIGTLPNIRAFSTTNYEIRKEQ